MEKVKVTQEVADAIEALRCGIGEYGYAMSIRQFEQKDSVDRRFVVTRRYFNEDSSLFIRAMLGEYEVEKSPEEELAEWYFSLNQTWGFHLDGEGEAKIAVETIDRTLEILGISIKGVDA